jgi:broad specificity phosphatase PhoE
VLRPAAACLRCGRIADRSRPPPRRRRPAAGLGPTLALCAVLLCAVLCCAVWLYSSSRQPATAYCGVSIVLYVTAHARAQPAKRRQAALCTVWPSWPMRLLIVRHGESENNSMTDDLGAMGLTGDAYQQELFRRHKSDPALTPTGEREAELLADFYAPILTQLGRTCHVFTSPFLRCCQTAWPLASRLSARVVCHPDLHENGGVHAVVELPNGQLAFDDAPLHSRGHIGSRGHAGKCMSAADIESRFPGFNTAMLPSKGQWYAAGAETLSQSTERARRVAAWLMTGQELHADVGEHDVVVLLIHGGFINSLLNALLVEGDLRGGTKVHFEFPNTATAFLSIPNPDDRVATVHWVGRVDHLANDTVGAHERCRL